MHIVKLSLWMGVAGGVGTAVAIATGGVPALETVGATITIAGDGVLGWDNMVWYGMG